MEFKEWKERVIEASTVLRMLMNVDDLNELASQTDDSDLVLSLWVTLDEDLEYLQVVIDRS